MPVAQSHEADEELYRRFTEQDTAAFEELLARYQEPVYRLVFRIIGRSEDARDVTEEVFINIWENPASYKNIAKFSTWLYRVATNRAISFVRLRRFKSLLSFSEHDPTDTYSDDPDDRPDIQTEQTDAAERIGRAMMKLPPRQRAAIHLRYREEMSVAEVAGVMNLSQKSVESLLFRAKQTLRKLLDGGDD